MHTLSKFHKLVVSIGPLLADCGNIVASAYDPKQPLL
jgi:hypothetical protein